MCIRDSDVAGGHGGFAMAMCRRHPRLQATILDLPASVAVGRRIVEEEGLEERISFHEGDALVDDLGAVSYTHLDVYKRQVTNAQTPGSAPSL